MKIVNAEEMRNIDRRTVERFGVPSIVLMENAALAVVDALFEHYPDVERVALFCGTGQNGGDGFAVARHLENRGVVPLVLIAGQRESVKGDALTNLVACERLGIPIWSVASVEDAGNAVARAAGADLLVDAIFGTGLDRAPDGLHAELIRGIAELRIPVLAIDLPSGVSASSPVPFDPFVQAELTVTFAAPKLCHVFEPAASHCGEVIVADISIPPIAIEEESVRLAIITPDDVLPHVSPRPLASHKGTWGHVGIVAGSPGRSGAAVLAARGAIRMGAGLVTIATDEMTAKLVHVGSLESMTWSGEEISEFLAGKDAFLVGPGLADNEAEWGWTREIIRRIDRPLVVDASGLNAFAGQLAELNPNGSPRLITPHPGELARLLGTTTDAIAGDRIGAAREAARISRSVVVLKGHQTLVAEPDGHVWVNPTGNPGMASGGMGDVLGGMAAALLARGVDPLDAAITAVYLHGLAGDLLELELGDTGLAAADLAEAIPRAIVSLTRGERSA